MAERESAARCLKHEERPKTPEKIGRFRKSYFSEPGQSVTHHGMIDDSKKLRERLAGKRLGARSVSSNDHVTDIFQKPDSGSIMDYVMERKESVYKTVRREPLGKPYIRGHDFSGLGPEKKTQLSDTSAKDLIYTMSSTGQREEKDTQLEEKYHEQYIKSHNSYEPGEQKHRKYNWKHIDPNTHRFGVVEAVSGGDGVGVCLQPDQNLNQPRLTNIAVANHRAMTSHVLGKPRYRGNVDSESTRRLEERMERAQQRKVASITAQACIQGSYTEDEQQPDKDLGRAIRPGWRNDTGVDRRFGCSTVRTDIPAPDRRSVSDNQNYGDDTNASKLLYPSRFVAEGVEDGDFYDPCEKDDIKDIMERIGYPYSSDVFERLYRRALFLNTGSETEHERHEQLVSISDFLKVHNERNRYLDIGEEPEWF